MQCCDPFTARSFLTVAGRMKGTRLTAGVGAGMMLLAGLVQPTKKQKSEIITGIAKAEVPLSGKQKFTFFILFLFFFYPIPAEGALS